MEEILPFRLMAFIQRRINVKATSQRCIDVAPYTTDVSVTLCKHHVPVWYQVSPVHLSLLTLQTKLYTFTNSVDPDETARNEPSH